MQKRVNYTSISPSRHTGSNIRCEAGFQVRRVEQLVAENLGCSEVKYCVRVELQRYLVGLVSFNHGWRFFSFEMAIYMGFTVKIDAVFGVLFFGCGVAAERVTGGHESKQYSDRQFVARLESEHSYPTLGRAVSEYDFFAFLNTHQCLFGHLNVGKSNLNFGVTNVL